MSSGQASGEHVRPAERAAGAEGEGAKQRSALAAQLQQAHEQLQDTDNLNKAVAHYKQYLQLCERSEDTEGQGAACFALARVHQRLQGSGIVA